MSPVWALLVILTIILLLFVIIPNLLPVHRQREVPVHSQSGNKQLASTKPLTDPMAKVAAQQEAERCVDRAMLKSYYPPPLLETTPVDYPRKAIGACPYSKSQSSSLPAVDIPMCMAASSEMA